MSGRGALILNVFLAVVALGVVVVLVAQNDLVAGGRPTATAWKAPLLATATRTATATADASWYANLPTPRPVLPSPTITRTPTRTTTPPTATLLPALDLTLTAFPTLHLPQLGEAPTATPTATTRP
jgi:hypothetical protein